MLCILMNMEFTVQLGSCTPFVHHIIHTIRKIRILELDTTSIRARSASSEQEHSDAEHSEKSPLVHTKLETFAKLLFNRSLPPESGKELATSPIRCANTYNFIWISYII